MISRKSDPLKGRAGIYEISSSALFSDVSLVTLYFFSWHYTLHVLSAIKSYNVTLISHIVPHDA